MKSRSALIHLGDLPSLCTAWADLAPTLIFCFCAPDLDLGHAAARHLSRAFTGAIIVGCSSAGEIGCEGARDGMISLLGLRFDRTTVRAVQVPLGGAACSHTAGRQAAVQLGDGGAGPVTAVFALSPGLDVNGSSLVRGLRAGLGDAVPVTGGLAVPITGGLAADGPRFGQTFTILNDQVYTDRLVAVGFQGDAIRVGTGSASGWMPFGAPRRVTHIDGSVLHTLDRKPALQLYCDYLGDRANELPSSGLLYPFALLKEGECPDGGLIRSVLSIDWETQSVILAGELPMGGLVRLMHADNDSLIDGAIDAATQVLAQTGPDPAVLLVSCVGRRSVLGDDVDDEIDAVRSVFPGRTPIAGFYSYGEIGPFGADRCAELHNQTMTITSFSER